MSKEVYMIHPNGKPMAVEINGTSVSTRMLTGDGIVSGPGSFGISENDAIKAALGSEGQEVFNRKKQEDKVRAIDLEEMHRTGEVPRNLRVFKGEGLG